MINFDGYAKNHYICEKDYIWNPTTCNCKNGKYLANIIDNSVIMCDLNYSCENQIIRRTKK